MSGRVYCWGRGRGPGACPPRAKFFLHALRSIIIHISCSMSIHNYKVCGILFVLLKRGPTCHHKIISVRFGMHAVFNARELSSLFGEEKILQLTV